MVGDLLGRAVSWFFGLITPKPAVKLPRVVLSPMEGPPVTDYKELFMMRDAGLHLRQRIDWLLTGDMAEPGTEVDFDEGTNDMTVTAEYEGVRRTHRITITEEPTPCTSESPTSKA